MMSTSTVNRVESSKRFVKMSSYPENKRDRSLRVNVDTGHCHCYHCGADFYVPDDVEERKNAERAAARKRRAAAIPQHFQRPVFDASKTTLSEETERWLVETRCIPQSVIAALRITEQEEFMPQSGKRNVASVSTTLRGSN